MPVTPDMASLEHELRNVIGALKAKEDMEIKRDERGLVISIGDNVFFDAGRAQVRQDAEPSVAAIASVLQKIPNRVVVEGHTDNMPVNDVRSLYASNWELSTNRATEVLRHLIKAYNIPPERLSAAGYAEFRPKATNTTAEGRAKNRRVDIIVLGKDSK
jgi:chemotaxis protein MotB